jgi:hypothetical protein
MAQPYEKASQKLSLKQIVWNNFIAGLAWAFGATIGLSIIIAILGLLAKNVDFIPLVGSFISELINFILQTNPNLQNY